MSDSQPPFGPPSGPPPPGSPPPDQISQGWPEPSQPPRRGGSKRRWLVVGSGVVAAGAIITGAAFGAAALLGGSTHDPGPQPAMALPASTFAYASIDTNPSDGELLDLLGVLAKFPGLTKHVSLSGGGPSGASADPRKLVFDAITEGGSDTGGCTLSWGTDLAPWLGTKFAVAGVDVDSSPQPVAVAQVTDTAKATAELTKLRGCDHGDAFALSGNWLLLAERQSVLDAVTSGTATGALADDPTYQHWMGQVGDPGFLTAYVAPSAGAMLADSLKDMSGLLGTPAVSGACVGAPAMAGVHPCDVTAGGPQFLSGICPGLANASGAAMSADQAMLRGFEGAALSMRVKDGGVEAESAVNMGSGTAAGAVTGGVAGATSGADAGGAQLVTSLPADTSAAIGVSVGPKPWERIVGSLAQVCGKGFDASKINTFLGGLTGLTFPGDIDTLLGNGIALSLGALDPSTLQDPTREPSKLPVALQFSGDAHGIQTVIGKILDNVGQSVGAPVGSVVGVDADGNRVAVGPDSAYRQQVLGNGGLGNDATFKNAVPDAGKASSIVYVNLNAFDPLLRSGDASAYADYYKPLQALGIAGWTDPDHTSHALLRLTTD